MRKKTQIYLLLGTAVFFSCAHQPQRNPLIMAGTDLDQATQKTLIAKYHAPAIILGRTTYFPAPDCYDTRRFGGGSEGHNLHGSAEGRNLGGETEGHNLHGSAEGRNLGGETEGHNLHGSAEGRNIGGKAEGHNLQGGAEGRNAGGAMSSPVCVKTENGFLVISHKDVIFYDGYTYRKNSNAYEY